MVRTQIQLTEDQSAILKQIAHERGVSMAEVIRQGIDLYLETTDAAVDDAMRHRALGAAGRFSSGAGDLAAEHDRHLAEAYRK